MKVVVAIDSFKGCMSSLEAGYAAKEGIERACRAEVVVKPLADGGEGTAEALVNGLGGRFAAVQVHGPMGENVTARYGILEDGKTAVMEMAEAAGITLVPKEDLDPWKAATTGVGEMIADAVKKGCRKFIIGIGGSATTEGGLGMLQSLGYEFYDEKGALLAPVFESLGKIARISGAHALPELSECHFQIACDVQNPLCGENGAVYVYGPQKGVRREERERMGRMMRRYAAATAAFIGKDNSTEPGSGAAGGLGFAFLSYLPDAELKPGVDIVLKAAGLEKECRDADIVVTGEGKLDAQTMMGKAPAGVARLAKKYRCRVIAFAGSVTKEAGRCNGEGIDAFFPIIRGVSTLEEAMDPAAAKENMSLAVEQVFRLLERKDQ